LFRWSMQGLAVDRGMHDLVHVYTHICFGLCLLPQLGVGVRVGIDM
jgi:hypothetical protein